MAYPQNIRRLRGALLVLMVVLAAAVVALYLFGRAGREPPRRPAAARGADPEEGLTAVGEGFSYALEEEGVTRFRIRGDSYQVDRENKVYLRQMELEVYAGGGEAYQVASRDAVFDPESEEAVLDGAVEVQAPGELTLTTPQLSLIDKGTLLVSRQPVAFRWGDNAEGGAQSLRGDLPERVFMLAGEVWTRSLPDAEPPYALRADRLFFDRERHQVRGEGNARVVEGDRRIDAQQIDLWLSEDNRKLEFVRALWEVRGSLPATASDDDEPGVRRTLTFEGTSLSAMLEPGTIVLRKLELEGSKRQRAILRTVAPGPLLRRLAAGYLAATFAAGEVARVEALVGVRYAEYPLSAKAASAAAGQPAATLRPAAALPAAATAEPPVLPPVEIPADPQADPLRQLSAERAEGLYQGGALSELMLYDGVEYADGEATATGNRARLDLAGDGGEFWGAPATLTRGGDRLVAPHLAYDRASGILNADGGTRSELRDAAGAGPLAGSPLGQGEGPIRVEADEATLRQEPRAFRFRGTVRAWRGENLLLADELIGDQASGRVTAGGDVRTFWHPLDDDGDRQPAIEVTAKEMIYREQDSTLVYRGGVRAVQGGRTISGGTLTLVLGDAGGAESMVAEGKVVIRDPASGRTIEGDRAEYEVGSERVVVEGESVMMRDGKGGEISGRRVVYLFKTGAAEVESARSRAGGDG